MELVRYWGRKAGEFSEEYIKKYSSPRELILDSFGGAGSIVKAALKLGRRVIYNDLNPFALLIARVEIEGVDENELDKAAQFIFSRKRIYYIDHMGEKHWCARSKFYEVKCDCGKKIEAEYFIWNGDNVEAIKADCDCNLFRYNIINNIEPLYNYPKEVYLKYSNGNYFEKRRQVDRISELFTTRNLILLSTLLNDIRKVRTDERTKRALMVAFASILFRASKMNRLKGGSWAINSYWIPKIHAEHNPYFLFENAIRRLKRVKPLSISGSLQSVLIGDSQVTFLLNDAKNLPLPDNSIDMIVTDPPFTDEIQYFELSTLVCSWLNLPLNFSDEIIVNPKQNKHLEEYFAALQKAFDELYRVLKPKRYAIIMFHEENNEILNHITKIIANSGFTIMSRAHKTMQQRKIGDRDILRGKDLIVFICRKV
jgi:adenine-specific DNA methylase